MLDTGPLVAWLDAEDQWHETAVGLSDGLRAPLITCEPVLTEACFLLQKLPRAIDQIFRWIESGQIEMPFRLEEAAPKVCALMGKYRDLPMSLADACLVAMVESGVGDRVFTLDEHFRLYRHRGRRAVPVLMPE